MKSCKFFTYQAMQTIHLDVDLLYEIIRVSLKSDLLKKLHPEYHKILNIITEPKSSGSSRRHSSLGGGQR